MFIFSADASVTLFGSESYVQVTANTRLQFLKDIGSMNVKTLDSDGILYYGSWSMEGVATGEYITVEVLNGSVQLATQIGQQFSFLIGNN